MVQTEIDWELKEAKKVLSMSNQSAIKGGITITDIERSMGLLEHIKTSDELIVHINGNRNRCKDWAYEGMDKLTGTVQTPKQDDPVIKPKEYSAEVCIKCGRKLTIGEYNYCDKNDLEFECYHCRNG